MSANNTNKIKAFWKIALILNEISLSTAKEDAMVHIQLQGYRLSRTISILDNKHKREYNLRKTITVNLQPSC